MPARRSKRPVNTTSTTVRVPAFCDWRQSPIVYPVTSQSRSLGNYPRSEGGLKEGRKPTTLFSEGTRNVIAAMKKQGVGRLVCLSSRAVEPDPALGVFFGKIMGPLLFKEMYEDTSRMEREVRQSGLEWVIVRPSTLTDEPAEGKYILGIDRIPKGWRIPREEVAEFALDQLEDERYLGRSIAMTT